MIQKFFKLILQHKVVAGIIILVVAVGGYFAYQNLFKSKGSISYITATAEKGTLIISVSGSGQVSASNQIDVKTKTSGDIVYLGVDNGQAVKNGALLFQLDPSDAQRSVRDAEVNLETAKLSLQKLENSYQSVQSGDDQLKKTYNDGLNESAKTYTDLSPILQSLDGILFDTTITDSLGVVTKEGNIEYYVDVVKTYDPSLSTAPSRLKYSYTDAETFYNQAFAEYKAVNINSASSSIENAIKDTYTLTKKVDDVIKTATDVIQFFKDKSNQENWSFAEIGTVNQQLTNLGQYAATVNGHLSNLFDTVQAITSDQIDIKSQQLAVEQKQNALLDAQETLADCYIRAPFDGIVTEIAIKKGDNVSTGATVATLITKQQVAEITLNEVDVAKVKLGQKATLTFDAVPDITISGKVVEIDTIGTVSQGVVSYGVKISFDTQDERIKPGMSVTTSIITDSRQDALVVPNAAIKQAGNASYVEIMAASSSLPQQQIVTTGLSNDAVTEILSGLKDGDKVVTQTITSSATTQTQSSNSGGLRIPGIGGFGR